ncbi:SdrD B-like domain-containing protein, partial [Staphylococcus condimenti]
MTSRRKGEKMFSQKKNKYSIRKFSIGIASIIIGGVLYSSTNEADAAETTNLGSVVDSSLSKSENSNQQPPGTTKNDTLSGTRKQIGESTTNPKTISRKETENSATGIKEAENNDAVNGTEHNLLDADNKKLSVPKNEGTTQPTLDSSKNNVTNAENENSTNAQEVNLQKNPITNASLTTNRGTNVNNLITISNPTISATRIDPNQSGSFRLKADYAVDGTVKQGDYFTVQMPSYSTMSGDSDYTADNNQYKTDLYSPSGLKVADGSYDVLTKKLTYTFTEWVNEKKNISGNFDLVQFTDRKEVKSTGIYPLSYDLAGEKFDTKMTYAYDTHDHGIDSAYVDSMITKVDATDTNRKFKEIIYVNPTDLDLNSAYLILKPNGQDSNAIIDVDTTKLHIYQVEDSHNLTDSYYFNEKEYQDLASGFYKNKSIYTNQNGDLEVNFGPIDSPFVVVMDSKFDSEISTNLNTSAILVATDKLGKRSTFQFDNNFVTHHNLGTGGYVSYRIGDYVWEDVNKDGLQNDEENPISGVKVVLKDVDGNVLQTTSTDKYGNYLFNDLANGDYTVEFTTPKGYVPTIQNSGTDKTNDSNGLIVPVTIDGADDLTLDSGFIKQNPATYIIGDKVWDDTNKDGIQNSNEPGIQDVRVTLTKPDGATETTTTDAAGNYKFTNLENGTYKVEFDTPKGYEPTKVDTGDDRLDSDGKTVEVTVNNADDLTIDSGFYKTTVEPTPAPATYTIGDKVWDDTNKDGIQ